MIFFLIAYISLPAERIQILYNSNYYPLEFTNDQGKADGFVIDLLYSLSREAAFEVSFIPSNWKQRERDLYRGENLFATGFKSAPRDISIITSKTLFSLPFSLLSVKELTFIDPNDLQGKIPLLSSGDSSEEPLFHYLMGPEKIIRTKSWTDAVKALDSGYGDFTIISELHKNLLDDSHGNSLFDSQNFSLALPYVLYTTKWDREKLEKLNNGLSIIRASGEYERIVEKWFAEAVPFGVSSSRGQKTLLFLIPVAILWVILLIIQIKRKVSL